jgi:hypothetical protein
MTTTIHSHKAPISFSHTLGGVTNIVIDYIKSAFPENYFKCVRVTTETPFNERADFKRNLVENPRPMLIIDPKFDINDDVSTTMPNEYDCMIPIDPQAKEFFAPPFMQYRDIGDISKGYYITKTHNKYKMTFDIVIYVDSQNKQYDVINYMKRNIRHRSKFPLRRYIENVIPSSFMHAIAGIEDLDVNTPEFQDTINKKSHNPVCCKVRPGGRYKDFFELTETPMVFEFTTLPTPDSVDSHNSLRTTARVGDSLTVEFVSPDMYYLVTRDDVPVQPVDSEILGDAKYSFYINVMGNPFKEYEGTSKLDFKATCSFDGSSDTLQFGQFLSIETIRLVDYFNTNNISVDFITAMIYRNGDTRLSDLEFNINTNKCELNLNEVPNIKDAYIIGIYVDYMKMNKLKYLLVQQQEI